MNLNKKNRFAGYLEAPVIEAVDDNARYRGSTAPAVEMPWLAYIGRVFTRLDAGAKSAVEFAVKLIRGSPFESLL